MLRDRWVAGLAILCTACVVLSGCTGLPDRAQEVARLESEIGSMPGVADFSAIYSNDITAGARLDLTVTMPEASGEQLAEVAKRINEVKGDDFDGYEQETDFVVGDGIYGSFGDVLNPDQVVDRSRRLRRMGEAVPGTTISWSGIGLNLRSAPAAAESFAAVRVGLGEDPARVLVLPRDPGPKWTVDFPFSVRQEEEVRRRLADLPVDVTSVTVGGGVVSELSVAVHDRKAAYQDLVEVIESVAPSRAHPVMLAWDWSDEENNAERKFSGSVHVSGCQYPDTFGEKEPQKYYTPAAIELRRQLRDEFDTCG